MGSVPRRNAAGEPVAVEGARHAIRESKRCGGERRCVPQGNCEQRSEGVRKSVRECLASVTLAWDEAPSPHLPLFTRWMTISASPGPFFMIRGLLESPSRVGENAPAPTAASSVLAKL